MFSAVLDERVTPLDDGIDSIAAIRHGRRRRATLHLRDVGDRRDRGDRLAPRATRFERFGLARLMAA